MNSTRSVYRCVEDHGLPWNFYKHTDIEWTRFKINLIYSGCLKKDTHQPYTILNGTSSIFSFLDSIRQIKVTDFSMPKTYILPLLKYLNINMVNCSSEVSLPMGGGGLCALTNLEPESMLPVRSHKQAGEIEGEDSDQDKCPVLQGWRLGCMVSNLSLIKQMNRLKSQRRNGSDDGQEI